MTISDSDPRFRRLTLRLREMQELTVAIGLFPESGYEPGTEITTAQIGLVHEFGRLDGTIPARSFMRSTLTRLEPKIGELNAAMLEVLRKDGRGSVKQYLKVIGELVKSGMQQTIRDGIDPPLAASTIAQRKNKGGPPLLDSGHMMNSITYKVRPAAENEGSENVVVSL